MITFYQLDNHHSSNCCYWLGWTADTVSDTDANQYSVAWSDLNAILNKFEENLDYRPSTALKASLAYSKTDKDCTGKSNKWPYHRGGTINIFNADLALLLKLRWG